MEIDWLGKKIPRGKFQVFQSQGLRNIVLHHAKKFKAARTKRRGTRTEIKCERKAKRACKKKVGELRWERESRRKRPARADSVKRTRTTRDNNGSRNLTRKRKNGTNQGRHK